MSFVSDAMVEAFYLAGTASQCRASRGVLRCWR